MVDTAKNLTCPACGKTMKKVYMKEAGINVDICLDGCGGILFDNRELEKFNSTEKISELFDVLKDKNFERVESNGARICPVCNKQMVEQGGGVAGVVIDVCYTCGAKFLDNGEFDKIKNEKNREVYISKIYEYVDKLVQKSLSDVVGSELIDTGYEQFQKKL